MCKAVFTFILLFIISVAKSPAQNLSIQWEHSFGGTQLDHAKWVEQTKDSGYIICGYTRSIDGDVTGNHGAEKTQQDAWLLRLDKHGNWIGSGPLGGTRDDEFTFSRNTPDGGFITTGFTNATCNCR